MDGRQYILPYSSAFLHSQAVTQKQSSLSKTWQFSQEFVTSKFVSLCPIQGSGRAPIYLSKQPRLPAFLGFSLHKNNLPSHQLFSKVISKKKLWQCCVFFGCFEKSLFWVDGDAVWPSHVGQTVPISNNGTYWCFWILITWPCPV